MSTGGDEGGTPTLSPGDAFAVLGNETRMEILQTLGEVDTPISFSELRECVGMRDSGQFNYHLDKLVGHFVQKTDEGYDLRQAGRRVIEAVLSGAVTEIPDVEPTLVDWSCPYCNGPVEVTYVDYGVTGDRPVRPYCTECAGLTESMDEYEHGQLADLQLSPAGIHGRTPREILQAAVTWDHLEVLAAYCDVCPRCQATIEHSVTVCEKHDPTGGRCDHCNRSYSARLSSRCTNCIFDVRGSTAAIVVFGNVAMLEFLAAHGINPLTDPWGPVFKNADEEIRSTDPFLAEFTFSIGADVLSLTVDDDLSVVDVTSRTTAESGR